MESQQEEWKSDWKDEYLKTVCTFASENGGRFIIGRRITARSSASKTQRN